MILVIILFLFQMSPSSQLILLPGCRTLLH